MIYLIILGSIGKYGEGGRKMGRSCTGTLEMREMEGHPDLVGSAEFYAFHLDVIIIIIGLGG